ncbi:hypothetical protein C0Z18_04785 [Trinickia dabaoshanensis]|uniref:DUF7079 domain-containing protein n=1 Tax=Trinickia dabaoshanensis TaxID=564714 RepID=A0A2N7VZT0_9BURK|nr:hypothetical protein [Trinickia dabaoshanensis]PMS22631.1 hypothetical protein C0Z18_04785 [Trinickia dabaoshanensis]
MLDGLSQNDREFIWEVMSEFFVDTEIDYDFEARRLGNFPREVLQEIFFREVAPVCGPNFLTPVPPIWLGFDAKLVKREINDLLARRKQSVARRLLCEANILFYRFWLRDTWKAVEAALERTLAAQGAKEPR